MGLSGLRSEQCAKGTQKPPSAGSPRRFEAPQEGGDLEENNMKESVTEKIKKLATNVLYGSIVFMGFLLLLFVIASILKSLNIWEGLFSISQNFICLSKPLVALFAAIFGASPIAKAIADKENIKRIKDTSQEIGKQPPYYIGKGNDNRFYYIGQNRDFDFNGIADYKTEIGTDWDCTVQWKPAIRDLLKTKKIGVDVDALPDYSGNGERHCRSLFFVFSTSKKIEHE
jgi:hypothetical protein